MSNNERVYGENEMRKPSGKIFEEGMIVKCIKPIADESSPGYYNMQPGCIAIVAKNPKWVKENNGFASKLELLFKGVESGNGFAYWEGDEESYEIINGGNEHLIVKDFIERFQ